MEKKDNKKTMAVVGTIAAILLCGCPGLSMCLLGAWTAFGGSTDFLLTGGLPTWAGYVGLCVAVIFIAIAVVVPILLLRKKKEPAAEDVLPPSEPLPPAS
jgi:phosphotransferase system  glucose/maltose/N-acetylglucosamine-specific IIC component